MAYRSIGEALAEGLKNYATLRGAGLQQGLEQIKTISALRNMDIQNRMFGQMFGGVDASGQPSPLGSRPLGGDNSNQPFVPTPTYGPSGIGIRMAQNPAYTKPIQAEQRQDRLEKSYADRLSRITSNRSGGLGLQDQKVNQAIDLRVLADQYYDPKTDTYSIPPAMHSELVLGLARLVSPNGVVGVELENTLRQKTAREGLANALIYLGADPRKVGGPTQDVIKTFLDSIDRQGTTSEKLRNKYLSDFSKMAPEGLNQDIKDRLHGVEMGSSFNQYMKERGTRFSKVSQAPKYSQGQYQQAKQYGYSDDEINAYFNQR